MVSGFFVDFVMKSYEEYAEDLLNSEKIVDESSDKDNLSNWRKKDEFKYPGIYLLYPKFKINDGKQIYLKVGISRGLKRRIRDHFSSRVTDRDPTGATTLTRHMHKDSALEKRFEKDFSIRADRQWFLKEKCFFKILPIEKFKELSYSEKYDELREIEIMFENKPE